VVDDFYSWNHPAWDQRSGRTLRTRDETGELYRSRVALPLDVDEPLTAFVDELPSRLDMLWLPREEESITTDGTLVLVIRGVCGVEPGFIESMTVQGRTFGDRHGVMLIGGLSFIPGIHEGVSIEDRQTIIHVIEQACLGLAGKPYDRSIDQVYPVVPGHVERVRLRKERDERVLSKAKAILCDHLSECQLEEFQLSGLFHVQGADGYTYLITNMPQHNVFRIEGDRRTVEYCIITDVSVPTYDQMLAQKLLLESSPEVFHEATNTWVLTEDGTRVYQEPANPRPHRTWVDRLLASDDVQEIEETL
jgi:hypothetical protein